MIASREREVRIAQTGGASGRGHIIFEPPEGDVVESSYVDEHITRKQMFVWASVYKAEIGAYNDTDLVTKTMPDGVVKHGIVVQFRKDKDGCTGWETLKAKTGTSLNEVKTHHSAEDSLHSGHSALVHAEVASKLRGAGMFGGLKKAMTVDEAAEHGLKIEQKAKERGDKRKPSGDEPASPPQKAHRPEQPPGGHDDSSDDPLSYLRAKSKSKKAACSRKSDSAASPLRRAKGGAVQKAIATKKGAKSVTAPTKQEQLSLQNTEYYALLQGGIDMLLMRFPLGKVDKPLLVGLKGQADTALAWFANPKHFDHVKTAVLAL